MVIVQAHLTFATRAQYGNMLLHTSAPRSLSSSRLGAATAHAVAQADRAVRGGSPPPHGAGSAWGGSPRGWSPEPAGYDTLGHSVLPAQCCACERVRQSQPRATPHLNTQLVSAACNMI